MAKQVTTIVDPSGTPWPLDGTGGLWLGVGRRGFHAPLYQHYRDESPAVDGAFWRGMRAPPRELLVPVVIAAVDADTALESRRALIAAISPRRGECVISSAYPGYPVRHITARYEDGMEGEEGRGEHGRTVLVYGIRFIADDPYFYGDAVSSEWDLTAPTRTELPIPGADGDYEVTSSPLIAGGVTISNTGDIDSYPEWTFTGPFTQITAANVTLGKTWTITYAAASATDRLFLTTRPGDTKLVDQDGVNRWSALDDGYQLWPLGHGGNTVNITLTGATEDSLAQLTYRPRFEAA